MNKTKFLTLAVAALALLNAAMLAFFLMHRPPHPKGGGPRKIIAERLHFDAAQVAAYEKLIERHQTETQAKGREMTAARKALFSLLRDENAPKKDSLAAAVGQIQQQIEDIHFRHFQDVRGLCRLEQIADFEALTADLESFFPASKKGK